MDDDLLGIKIIVFAMSFIWFLSLVITTQKDHKYQEFSERVKDDIWSR